MIVFYQFDEEVAMRYNRDSELKFTPEANSPLSTLDASLFTTLTRKSVRRTYEKGQIVCMEGEPCPGLMMIETGWLTGVKISPQGREQEIRLAGPGEMVNIISVMAGGNNLITLKSIEASVLWIIEREALFDLMAEHPQLNRFITQDLAKRVVHLLNLVEDLSLRNVEGRLANLLLNRSKNGIIQRENWLTEAEIASSIGTTSVIISRILNEMEDQGAIRLEHHQIQILKPELLKSDLLLSYK
jgi:CRP-like cAMP-binding protein